MPSLNGKVALVTGASRGIGARIAFRMAQVGAKVVVNFAGGGMPQSRSYSPSRLPVEKRLPFKAT